MQTIVLHRGGFCFAKFISGWFKSLRIHTRIHLHRKKRGDRVLRQIRTMLCADFVEHREHTLRIRIAVWQEEKRLHQFRDRGVFVVACNSLQTGHGRPECIDAIVHGRKIGHSFTQSWLKWALYAFFFLAFPAHGDPLRLDPSLFFCIIQSSGL